MSCSERQPFVHRSLAAGRPGRALGWLLLGVLCGCSVDAVVYRAREPANVAAGRGASGAGAGAAGTLGEDEVCDRLGSGGAGAIVSSVIYAPDGGLRFDPRCTTDAGCRAKLFTPVCDEASSLCVGCPPAELTDFTARVVSCLLDARDRCCITPAPSADCIFSGCMMGCGAQ